MPEDTWTTGYAAMTVPTGTSHMAGPLGGLIYSLGGISGPGGSTVEDRVYAYDHAADTWTAKASMPGQRYASGTAVANGKVWVIGGVTGGFALSATVYEYTPGTNTWATKTAGPTTHQYSGCEAIGTTIYVAYKTAGGPMDAYDTTTDTWTGKAASGTAAATAVAAAVLGVNLYALTNGGDHNRYDSTANTWTGRTSPGGTTSMAGFVGVPSFGTLFLNYSAGGSKFTKSYTAASDTWATKTAVPTIRGNQDGPQIAAVVNNNFVHVIGGATGGPNERYQVGPDPLWYVGSVALTRT